MSAPCPHGATRYRCGDCKRDYQRDYSRRIRRAKCERGHNLLKQQLAQGEKCRECREKAMREKVAMMNKQLRDLRGKGKA